MQFFLFYRFGTNNLAKMTHNSIYLLVLPDHTYQSHTLTRIICNDSHSRQQGTNQQAEYKMLSNSFRHVGH